MRMAVRIQGKGGEVADIAYTVHSFGDANGPQR